MEPIDKIRDRELFGLPNKKAIQQPSSEEGTSVGNKCNNLIPLLPSLRREMYTSEEGSGGIGTSLRQAERIAKKELSFAADHAFEERRIESDNEGVSKYIIVFNVKQDTYFTILNL